MGNEEGQEEETNMKLWPLISQNWLGRFPSSLECVGPNLVETWSAKLVLGAIYVFFFPYS